MEFVFSWLLCVLTFHFDSFWRPNPGVMVNQIYISIEIFISFTQVMTQMIGNMLFTHSQFFFNILVKHFSLCLKSKEPKTFQKFASSSWKNEFKWFSIHILILNLAPIIVLISPLSKRCIPWEHFHLKMLRYKFGWTWSDLWRRSWNVKCLQMTKNTLLSEKLT